MSTLSANVTVCENHVLIQVLLTQLRDERTDSFRFRSVIEQLTALLLYPATQDIAAIKHLLLTPTNTSAQGYYLENTILLIPIMRAGMTMEQAAYRFFPNAISCHIGLKRDETTAIASAYYESRPAKNVLESSKTHAFLFDPMLATGGSAADAITKIKSWGVRNITFVGIIAAPEGISYLQNAHPDVKIVVAAVDKCLNEKKYILPGLGDAGDRTFNTVESHDA